MDHQINVTQICTKTLRLALIYISFGQSICNRHAYRACWPGATREVYQRAKACMRKHACALCYSTYFRWVLQVHHRLSKYALAYAQRAHYQEQTCQHAFKHCRHPRIERATHAPNSPSDGKDNATTCKSARCVLLIAASSSLWGRPSFICFKNSESGQLKSTN